MEEITSKRVFLDNRVRLRLESPYAPPESGKPTTAALLQVALEPAIPKSPEPERCLRVMSAALWEELNTEGQQRWLESLLLAPPLALIFGDAQLLPPRHLNRLKQQKIALFYSPLPAHRVCKELNFYRRSLLGESRVLHGVFLEVYGVGLMLTGESGLGKSELGLELISRGHRFIADDAPEVWRCEDALSGACPALLQDYLEVRGLGFIDIRALFGDSSVKLRKNLQLIVQLRRMQPDELGHMERSPEHQETREMLGVTVPVLTLPVTAGRPLAVLVETAVRIHIQRRQGVDSNRDFCERQQQMIDQQG